jgi:hypothetical protein
MHLAMPSGPVNGASRSTPEVAAAVKTLNEATPDGAVQAPTLLTQNVPPPDSTPSTIVQAGAQEQPSAQPGDPSCKEACVVKTEATTTPQEITVKSGESTNVPAPVAAGSGSASADMKATVEVDGTAPATAGGAPATIPDKPAGSAVSAVSESAKSATCPATVVGAVRLVNSKRISLGYEIRDVGPSGVNEIELWCTRDGHSWQKMEAFAPSQSPCVIEVDEEDLYGFSLVARSGVGLSKPPQEGERPQVWVEVDVTKPTVRLLAVEAVKAGDDRNMNFQWKATDKNLAAKPITLYYATQESGPWLPIVAQLENTGSYVWQMPKEVPHQLFVRIEAADQVGNIGTMQTVSPVMADPSMPSTSIMQVHAVEN